MVKRFARFEVHRVALDQIRAVDKTRLVRRLGSLDEQTAHSAASTLVEMFTY